jgi:heme-degrading monooxygenase HmoA
MSIIDNHTILNAELSQLADTPEPPYYAVIFTSTLQSTSPGYDATADKMLELAAQQPGYLGAESAREDVGITVSYWKDLVSIQAWKNQPEHEVAQVNGKKTWYSQYKVRIAKVERCYGFENLP